MCNASHSYLRIQIFSVFWLLIFFYNYILFKLFFVSLFYFNFVLKKFLNNKILNFLCIKYYY